MLTDVAGHLDDWITARNRDARAEGMRMIAPCRIRLIGQTALLELDVPLTLVATQAVDVKADYEYLVEAEFRRLLEARGRFLDPVGHEAWMPPETVYTPIYSGRSVEMAIADAESILLSKALKAPAKNRALLLEYLAKGPSPRFLELATKHHLDLEELG